VLTVRSSPKSKATEGHSKSNEIATSPFTLCAPGSRVMTGSSVSVYHVGIEGSRTHLILPKINMWTFGRVTNNCLTTSFLDRVCLSSSRTIHEQLKIHPKTSPCAVIMMQHTRDENMRREAVLRTLYSSAFWEMSVKFPLSRSGRCDRSKKKRSSRDDRS
jgi:hypothetical protein